MERNQIIQALEAAIAILKSSQQASVPGGGTPAPSRTEARQEMGRQYEPADIPDGTLSGQIKFISTEPSKGGRDQAFIILGWRQQGESFSAKFYSWDNRAITDATQFEKGDIVEIDCKPWKNGAGTFSRIARKG